MNKCENARIEINHVLCQCSNIRWITQNFDACPHNSEKTL